MVAVRALAHRHAPVLAVVLGVFSLVTCGIAVAGAAAGWPTQVDRGDLVSIASQILAYGLVGAVLVAKRPDLPFGWVLALAATTQIIAVVSVGTSVAAFDSRNGGSLAVWGLTAGALQFVPAALEGVVNVRFPTGVPRNRWDRVLERAIVAGIAVGVLAGVVGDSNIRALYPDGTPGDSARAIDGTALTPVANSALVAIPVVIGLGVVAGAGVLVRFIRSTGIERQQLKWRAGGVIAVFLLFPLVVTEVLPRVVDDAVSAAAPVLFVTTLVVPILRYDLWAIDAVIRRSAAATLDSPDAVVQNTLRVAAGLLHLPYLAVVHDGRVLAAAGRHTTPCESWPIVVESGTVGDLIAAPRFGFDAISVADRQVLATIARLVGGSVRAEALTTDLRSARQQLVSAREEERRRLRRDLHDGLGPLLTGLGLNLDAAASHLAAGDDKAAAYVGNARQASADVIVGIRDLVDGLRPPALDELGLAGALDLHVRRLAADAGCGLDLRVPPLLALPAAVEVAAFRTVVEAVTNAARHAAARHVEVEIENPPGRLVVIVTDDGPGRTPWRAGLGLTGMGERAEELGGSLCTGPTPAGGRVRASFPLDGSS